LRVNERRADSVITLSPHLVMSTEASSEAIGRTCLLVGFALIERSSPQH